MYESINNTMQARINIKLKTHYEGEGYEVTSKKNKK